MRFISSAYVSDGEMNKLGIDKEFVDRSNCYNIEKLKISMVSTVIGISVIYFILLSSGLDMLNDYSSTIANNIFDKELLMIIIFYLTITLINLPINCYKTFVVEERFGFNKTSKKLFIRDFIVSTILSLFIVILLFKSFEYLYHMSTDFWWLYVWLLFIFVNLLTAYIFPTLIAPIFNKFEKLDDWDKYRIMELFYPKTYFLAIILGGSFGNLFDRYYYNAVPDFIDLNYKGYHWFIFNVADIFITFGIFCLILAELLNYKKKNDKK